MSMLITKIFVSDQNFVATAQKRLSIVQQIGLNVFTNRILLFPKQRLFSY